MNETTNYKKYIGRQLGLVESQFVPLPKKEAIEPQMSPTARPPTILALGIRGSTTGGLPSGADQLGKDISPTKVGGYDRVTPQNLNSKLINKTPNNPDIKQDGVPINNNPSTEDGVTHPHQIQVTAHEEPQSVTGASTDSDPTLTLKSASPKGIEVDIPGENQEPEQEVHNEDDNTTMIPSTSLSETFARHKRLMRERLGMVESKGTCPCGCEGTCQCPPNCKCKKNKNGICECATCGCGDPSDMHDHDEEEDDKTSIAEGKHKAGCECGFCKNKGGLGKKKNDEPEENLEKETETKKQQRLDESYAAPFQRMRSMAGIGNVVLTSNGLMETKHDPGAAHPFNTNWKMDSKKAGYVKIDEEKLKQVKASLDRKSKRGSLSDKEMELVKRMDEVLKKRGMLKEAKQHTWGKDGFCVHCHDVHQADHNARSTCSDGFECRKEDEPAKKNEEPPKKK